MPQTGFTCLRAILRWVLKGTSVLLKACGSFTSRLMVRRRLCACGVGAPCGRAQACFRGELQFKYTLVFLKAVQARGCRGRCAVAEGGKAVRCAGGGRGRWVAVPGGGRFLGASTHTGGYFKQCTMSQQPGEERQKRNQRRGKTLLGRQLSCKGNPKPKEGSRHRLVSGGLGEARVRGR